MELEGYAGCEGYEGSEGYGGCAGCKGFMVHSAVMIIAAV